MQSPFVFWGALTEELLEQALDCLPAAHLKHWFERLLLDIKANRAGMPDLIQFWPEDRTYRMIEVKGPGIACRTTNCAGWTSARSMECRWPCATCSGGSRVFELPRCGAGALRVQCQER